MIAFIVIKIRAGHVVLVSNRNILIDEKKNVILSLII